MLNSHATHEPTRPLPSPETQTTRKTTQIHYLCVNRAPPEPITQICHLQPPQTRGLPSREPPTSIESPTFLSITTQAFHLRQSRSTELGAHHFCSHRLPDASLHRHSRFATTSEGTGVGSGVDLRIFRCLDTICGTQC